MSNASTGGKPRITIRLRAVPTRGTECLVRLVIVVCPNTKVHTGTNHPKTVIYDIANFPKLEDLSTAHLRRVS
jgi:hypothetical protein